jgi:hypothetical protein
MDDTRREFVSGDGIRWHYTIEYQEQENGVAWRAQVWEEDAYRGVLEGCVWTEERCDPDAVSHVALKMALDAHYLRDFAQDADDAPAASAEPADDAGVAADPIVPKDSDAADGLPGPDPLPTPA